MIAPAPAPPLPVFGAAVENTFQRWMKQGMAAHEAGDRVLALSAFEKALALAPGQLQAVSACATLLSELARPRAALACLQAVQAQLLADADGAANLGIAAVACGEREAAKAFFLQALEHDAGHARALQHMAAMHAQDQQWDAALAFAIPCLESAPDQQACWLAVADVLMAACRHEEALAHLARALQRFPGHPALTLRQAVTLAHSGDFEAADALLAPSAGSPVSGQQPADDARSIFCRHAFEALQVCDWRDQERLLALVKQDLARWADAAGHGQCRDKRAALVCGPVLPLGEGEMQLAGRAMWQPLGAGPARPGRPFSAADVLNRQGAIRIGIAARSLRDEAATAELAALLALHDSARFEFFVYSPTPQPQAALAQALAPHRVIEIAHFSDDEALARVRLDRLDIWLDLTFGTPGWRPVLAARRVAPVQLQHPGWPAASAHAPLEYTLSDGFIHPAQDARHQQHTALLRLPHTCWLAMPARPEDVQAGLTREQAGLPAQALVLCAFAPSLHIDRHSFSVWMKLLGQLPAAVLWLPPLGVTAQDNLRREARAAGIDASRLCFAVAATRQQRLACLALADLFMDSLRISSRQDLGDALAVGVPALSCAGGGMAARVGGSLLHAAGLADCVFDKEADYVAAILRLGNNRIALQQLRKRLQAGLATAPLFDLPARVRELEAAWTFMAGRARAGRPPESLDIPLQPPKPLLF